MHPRCSSAMHPFGIATRAQLRVSGQSDSTISRNYHRVLPRIYSIEEPSPISRCYAVTVWQPGALLSHRTAAWLYGWIDHTDTIDATVPSSHHHARTPPWLTLHRRALRRQEATECQSLPVVTRERALIDCIAVMIPEDVARVVDERLTTDIDPDTLEFVIRSTPHMRGNARAKAQLRSASLRFASEPERVLARALTAIGLLMHANFWVGRYMCDFVDELARVIVEVDGFAFHSRTEVFSKDRRRQNELVLDGWLMLRFSAYDVMANPDKVARQIADVVRRRRAARR